MNFKEELEQAKTELSEITDKINQLNAIKEQLTASGNKILGKIEFLTELVKEDAADDTED